MYEAPPVLNLNLRGLFSSTDLMSLEAAGAEPDILRFVCGMLKKIGWYDSEVCDLLSLEAHREIMKRREEIKQDRDEEEAEGGREDK